MSDPRTTRNDTCVRHLHSYLLAVQREPTKHLGDERLQSALTSQSALAHFELPEAGITAMSLNTAKRAAAAALEDGGYAQLDRLRLDCAQALVDARSASTAKRTRHTQKSLRERAEAAEHQVFLLSEDLQIATGLLRECMRQARAYAKRADAATQSLCDKEQREVLHMLGLFRTRPE